MRARKGHIAVPLLAALIGGCAGASTDPHTGGLAGGINGLATGAYDERIEARQVALDDMDAAGDALGRRVGQSKDRLRDLDRQLAAQAKGLEKLRAVLADVDRAIAASEADLAAQKAVMGGVADENTRKSIALKPLKAERDMLARMVEELEENHRVEAHNYQRSKQPPTTPARPAGDEVQLADVEQRARAFEKKQEDTMVALKRVQATISEMSTRS